MLMYDIKYIQLLLRKKMGQLINFGLVTKTCDVSIINSENCISSF